MIEHLWALNVVYLLYITLLRYSLFLWLFIIAKRILLWSYCGLSLPLPAAATPMEWPPRVPGIFRMMLTS
jgi:hypothetical protein